ncbi:MAG TPA: hypothetical protein VEY49_09420 [Solirubrobacteraceae bacterium]|nr:hypothetical protein [Solirubrobacteraceae bacterium]
MPAYNRAPLSAELTVGGGDVQLEALREAAGASGLARESGPDSTLLAGGRAEVLEAAVRAIEAALDAGARSVDVRVEATEDADRFDSPS